MRKIHKLFIIFVIFFLFADVLTTYLGMSVKKSAIAEKVKVPEKCICTYPPECDSSPVLNNLESETIKIYNWILPVLLKLIACIILFLIIKRKNMYLIFGMLDILLIWIVFGNLKAIFFPFRTLFVILAGISIFFFMNYFFKPNENQ